MNIKEYLEKKHLLLSGDSFYEYQDMESKTRESHSITTMSIDMLDLRDYSDKMTQIIKDRWKKTEKLLVIGTSETKSSGLGQILKNTLPIQGTPVGPGLYFFFKDPDLEQIYNFSLQVQDGETTKEDVLVYLALARLRNESVLSTMPDELKNIIKKYLGNNIRAIAESRKLLAAIAQPGLARELCEKSDMGIQDDEAMWIHTSLIRKLDPSLRVYIGCSSFFFGDSAAADIIKIHKNSSKITYYLYDDFENKLLPEMHDRIKVDLSRQKVDHFDHRKHNKPEVLFFKERFVSPEDSRYDQWKNFSLHLQEKGIKPRGIHIERCNNIKEILNSYCA